MRPCWSFSWWTCVCVCPLLQVCVCVCVHCSRGVWCVCVCPLLQVCVCPLLQVCVCVCVCVHCSRCVWCVCGVSTAPGVCVCPLLQVWCVCPLLRVCVSTAPGVCALGWVKCREKKILNFTAGYTLYNCVTNKIKNIVFFQNRYPIMVKCLNIGKNIGKPIYRSISSLDSHSDGTHSLQSIHWWASDGKTFLQILWMLILGWTIHLHG